MQQEDLSYSCSFVSVKVYYCRYSAVVVVVVVADSRSDRPRPLLFNRLHFSIHWDYYNYLVLSPFSVSFPPFLSSTVTLLPAVTTTIAKVFVTSKPNPNTTHRGPKDRLSIDPLSLDTVLSSLSSRLPSPFPFVFAVLIGVVTVRHTFFKLL